MNDYLMLAAACMAFVGSHFLMSHPLRAFLLRRFRANGFMLFYSAVSLLTFAWMAFEFVRAPKEAYAWPVGDVVWIAASIITLVAAVLFTGSFVRNPSLPGMPDAMAAQKPFGVFKATRHPMMWGFALWGVAHILVAPRFDNFLFSGSIIFLALVGAKGQEIKKRKLNGVEWDSWLRRTRFGIRPDGLLRAGWGPWLGGVLLWTAATWAHPYWGVAGAGMFKYLQL